MQKARCRRRAIVALIALVSGLLTACGGTGSTPQATLKAFLADWGQRDWTAMAKLVDRPPPTFAATNAAAFSALGVTRVSYSSGVLQRAGSTAAAPVTGHLVLASIGAWALPTTVHLRDRGGHWLVEWSSTTIAPALVPGAHFAVTRTWAPRASILGAGDAPLVSQEPQIQVGVVGQRIKDPAQVTSLLVAAGAPPAAVATALAQAKLHPTYFEPVFTVSKATYEASIYGTAVYSIPGTSFVPTSQRAAITPGLAAHLVGTTGPVTAQELHTLGAAYQAGDVVGQTGLEQYDQSQLAGTPGGTVMVVSSKGATLATLETVAPKPGQAVRTSIDPTVQRAGEAALAGVTQPAALVAVRAATGQILASVSQDPPGQGLDYALDATVPPGSTFKTVTATALIMAGLTPTSPATCPPELTVDGKPFKNVTGEAGGRIDNLGEAFAQSCNTAFIGLATKDLQPASFPQTAALFGIGVTPRMGYPAFGGKVPAPSDGADLAATAIGQGQVLVSPLDMAMVAADIDAGAAHQPRLVVGAPDDASPPTPIDPAVVTDLHQMMAQVVTTGTAAGQGLPAGTDAKTGTAEFGTATPPATHAWLIGFEGAVAFAVFVYGGGTGGPVAGPLAARFLKALGPAA